LLDAEVGVIETESPVISTKAVLLVVEKTAVMYACTTCNIEPVGNVLLGTDCDPVMVEPDTDAISPEATCVKAIIGSPLQG
jgi:hypothetical protein